MRRFDLVVDEPAERGSIRTVTFWGPDRASLTATGLWAAVPPTPAAATARGRQMR